MKTLSRQLKKSMKNWTYQEVQHYLNCRRIVDTIKKEAVLEDLYRIRFIPRKKKSSQ